MDGRTLYDREFKADCARQVLARYNRFINVPKHDEDKRLLFFLTMCRMLDRAHGNVESPLDGMASLHRSVNSEARADGAESSDADAESLTAPENELWNLTALERNQDRLFAAYRFDNTATMQQNFDRFVDRLLDAPFESTLRFI